MDEDAATSNKQQAPTEEEIEELWVRVRKAADVSVGRGLFLIPSLSEDIFHCRGMVYKVVSNTAWLRSFRGSVSSFVRR